MNQSSKVDSHNSSGGNMTPPKADYLELAQAQPQFKDTSADKVHRDKTEGQQIEENHGLLFEPLLQSSKTNKTAGQESHGMELAQFGSGQSQQNEQMNDGLLDIPAKGNFFNNSLSVSRSQQFETQSQLSGNSRLTLRNRSQNPCNNGVNLKMHQNWFDHLKIFIYHCIEPVLIATAISMCMQLPTLSTLIYNILMFLGLLPLILSSNQTNIKFKSFLCTLMIIMAAPLCVFKGVMIYQYRRDDTKFQEKPDLWAFMGIIGDYPILSVIVDIIQIIICFFLVWHYSDQKRQADKRLTALAKLEFQTEIKLHHPNFGRKWQLLLTVCFLIFLLDTFIMLSFLQLIVILLIIFVMFAWRNLIETKSKALLGILRVIQVLSIAQLLASFCMELPLVHDPWIINNERVFHLLGLAGMREQMPYNFYARLHSVTIAFAVCITELVATSFMAEEEREKRIDKSAPLGAINPLLNRQTMTQNSVLLTRPRASSRQKSNYHSLDRGVRSSHLISKSLGGSEIKLFGSTSPQPDQLERQIRMNRSANLVKQRPTEEKSLWQRFKMLWDDIHASSALLIWICRLLAFTWAYCYHDWQSVVLLFWIMHSTLYRKTSLFKKWMLYVYMPLITAIFLWYYIINIFSFLPWESIAANQARLYTFGFYKFTVPALEIAFMFTSLFFFCRLTIQLSSGSEADKKFEQHLNNQIGNKQGSLFWQFLFLFLVYIEYPLMLFLVLAGLDKMDIYHITMLFFFVWYTLKPSIIKNNSIFLLIYADLFVLEKYIYTMFDVSENPRNWIEVMGFSTEFDYDSKKEYFRYMPRVDQWLLVMLTFCLYRRQEILGIYDGDRFEEYRTKAQNQIKLRMPRLYQFWIYCDIVYTYTIVIMAFTLYLVITILIRACLINAITQTLVLVLLLVYLNMGIKKLMRYWNLLIWYQAIVLIVMVSFQFMVHTPDFDTSNIKAFFDSWPDWAIAGWHWFGFEKYEDPINLKLLPYVIFFSLAVILAKNFQTKLQIEQRQLYTYNDVLDENERGELQNFAPFSSERGSQHSSASLDQACQGTKSINLDRSEETETRQRMLEQLMRNDPSGDYKNVEPVLVYNYGRLSGTATQTIEVLHHKQVMTMRYKLSYLTYKMKKAWPVLDIIAAYFYIVLNVVILAFAIYYQLAVFWALALTIYMVAQMINSKNMYTYRQAGSQIFVDKLNDQAAARLDKTEKETLNHRASQFLIVRQKKKDIEVLRRSKGQIVTNSRYAQNLHTPRLSNEMQQKERTTGRFGTTSTDLHLASRPNSTTTPQNQMAPRDSEESMREDNAQDQTINSSLATENKDNRRLKITDEEVIGELQSFNEQIHLVSLKSRYFAWFSLMILLILGLTLTYISSFANVYAEQEGGTSPFSDSTRERLVFLFFWGGVYSDSSDGQYYESTYPFYVTMILLICERLAQLWIETRFGCSDGTILKFRLLEKEDNFYRQLAKEKKKAADRTTVRRAQSIRRSHSRVLTQTRNTLFGSATESIDSENKSNADETDSLKTDPELQNKSHDEKTLLTIVEEANQYEESIVVQPQLKAATPTRSASEANHSFRRDPEQEISAKNSDVESIEEGSNGTSINQSYHQSHRSVVLRTISSDVDLLLRDSKEDHFTESPERKLSVIPETAKELKASISDIDLWDKRDENKQKLLEELKPLLNVNSKLRFYRAIKQMLENFCILFVWLSCIYKQNIFSMMLFFFLVIYTYNRSGNTLLAVRTCVVVLFVVQYWLEVANLSSYNSPKAFPDHLVSKNMTVYPNTERFFYDIPLALSYNQSVDDMGQLTASANLNITSYFSLDMGARKLNGLWIDFIMTATVAIYFSLCNFWVLFRPVKVTSSENTINKLKKYAAIINFENNNKRNPITIKQIKHQLKQQFGLSKCIKSWAENLYLTFPILLIAFTLAISIFNKSILSFGYIIFVMILVFDNIHFLKHRKGQDRMYCILKCFMLPYLLIDIWLQLIYQIPIEIFDSVSPFSAAIGFQRFWVVLPETLNLGDEIDVVYQVESSLTTMMLKGVTFFFITIQLQLISSFGYQKFMQARLEKDADETEKVGQGITYRFNNFKSKSVLKQAKETQSVERMLWHVKRLIRKREILYKDVHRRKTDSQVKQRRQSIDLRSIVEKHESSDSSSNEGDDLATQQQRLEARTQAEKCIIKLDYHKRMNALNCCNKFYLWLRRNWVVDILFRQCHEQLDDMVYQMRSGRTSVKTQIEIGHNNLVRQERQKEVEQELSKLMEKQMVDRRHSENNRRILAASQLIEEEDEAPDKKEVKSSEGATVAAEDLLSEKPATKLTNQTSTVRDSYEFNRRLNNMMSSLEGREQRRDKIEKNHLANLLKSKLFRPASKPWEAVNMQTFLSWQKMVQRYLVVTYKTLISYSELFCYFMMLLATLMKAGFLYMVYPISIFGYCLLEEQRPGRIYWYSILTYTSILIIFNFLIQLEVWDSVLSKSATTNLKSFFEGNRLGVHRIEGDDFGATFVFYLPEIFILFTVLLHIQKETLSGVFNVPYERYENFEAGLLRYRLHVLCNTDSERKQVSAQFYQEEALKIKLDKKTIDEFRENDGNLSEGDKFLRSEQIGDPIRVELRSHDLLLPKQYQSIEELLSNSQHQGELINLDAILDYDQDESEGASESESSEYEVLQMETAMVQSEDNVIYKNKDTKISRLNPIELMKWLVWDNSFMRRLFPDIKQQKPGQDFYVYVATIQIILLVYVFLFYTAMAGNETDIATQFSTNELSSNMVIVLICGIFIICIDRILYSTHAFLSGAKTTYDEKSDAALQDTNDVNGLKQSSDTSPETSLLDADTSMLHRQSGQPYGRKSQALYSIESEKKEFNKKNTWIEDQFAVSDDSDDNAEEDLFYFNRYLVPQKQQRSCAQVIKFYWFWAVLILAHIFVFFILPSTVANCKDTPQLDEDTNEIINYGNPAYNCNTFENSPSIIIFYLLLCFYFFVQSYQMRIGLPEIRKGSFLMDTFNPVTGVVYRGFLAIPFIFELRTLIDWTFTTTALDAFQWIKLAQIQANMYVAKCVNKDYMDRPLGQKIKKWEKIVVGFGLVFFIILMIVGPIVLFSTLNPVATLDNPVGGQLQATLSYLNLEYSPPTKAILPLFLTTQVTSLKSLNPTEWDSLGFANQTQTTGQFSLEQTKALQFSETSDYAWIISSPQKTQMKDYLNELVNGTLSKTIQIYYNLEYSFDREDAKYGPTAGKSNIKLDNSTDANIKLASNLANMMACINADTLTATFPANITINQKTNQDPKTMSLETGIASFDANYTLKFKCDAQLQDAMNDYWTLKQVFRTYDAATESIPYQQVQTLESQVFPSSDGFGFILFQQKVLPSFLQSYSVNLIFFYVGVVYVVATIFRSVFVPRTWEIFIIDAPFTEDILKICQSIHVYRVQRELEKQVITPIIRFSNLFVYIFREEELYQILIDIMRSPEMIKALSGSSLKKKLE